MKMFTEGVVSAEWLDVSNIRIKVGSRHELDVSLSEFNDLIKCGEELLHQRKMDQDLMADLRGSPR